MDNWTRIAVGVAWLVERKHVVEEEGVLREDTFVDTKLDVMYEQNDRTIFVPDFRVHFPSLLSPFYCFGISTSFIHGALFWPDQTEVK